MPRWMIGATIAASMLTAGCWEGVGTDGKWAVVVNTLTGEVCRVGLRVDGDKTVTYRFCESDE